MWSNRGFAGPLLRVIGGYDRCPTTGFGNVSTCVNIPEVKDLGGCGGGVAPPGTTLPITAERGTAPMLAFTPVIRAHFSARVA